MGNVSDSIKKLKAAIYIRVSTHWQVDKDSLQVQRRELIAYCEMVLGIKDYFVFEDPGYSAKNTDRPAYQDMMNRLRAGEFSHLVTWKIDRISRNLLDFSSMYKELKDAGITFVSKNEQFDTSNAIGEAMLKIILVFAELERMMTAERVTAVMLSRANNGQWNGGRIPYGYSYDKETKEFSISPEEGKIAKRMFDLYEQYQSTLYIANYLNEQGLSSRSGTAWSATTVYKILTNPFYIGQYRYNIHDGTGKNTRQESEWVTIETHHVPLVDTDQYDRVQYRLKRKKRGGVKTGETYMRKNVHIFSGLLSCGKCGAAMASTLDKRRSDGWRPSIYACGTRRKSKTICTSKYVSDVTLGPFIFNYIANIIRAKNTMSKTTTVGTLQNKLLRGDIFSDVEHIDGLEQLREILIAGETGIEYRPPEATSDGESISSERDRLEYQKRKRESALSRLKALYLYDDDGIPEKDYVIERHKIMKEIEGLDERLSAIRDVEDKATMSDEFIEKASYFIMVENLLSDRTVDFEKYIRRIDPAVPRAFINNVISGIVVSDGAVQSITFRNGMVHTFKYRE